MVNFIQFTFSFFRTYSYTRNTVVWLLLTVRNEGNSLPPWGLIGATASMCSYLFRRDQEESGSGSLGHIQ